MPFRYIMIDCLYEDPWLMVVNKPVGLGTCGMPSGTESLFTRIQAHLRNSECTERQPFVGVLSRLDVPVSGLMMVAKTVDSARLLTQAMQAKRIEKIYYALVSGVLSSDRGLLEHGLRIRGTHNKVRCVPVETPNTFRACLNYRVLQRYSRATLLEVKLETGRKHQIRTQLSHFGHPIWGDYKYGSRIEIGAGIALYSQQLTFPHPQSGEILTFSLGLPPHWPSQIEEQSQADSTWLGRTKS